MHHDSDAAPWLARFRREVLGSGQVLEADNYLYRPGELLVHADDHDHLADHLTRLGAEPDHERTAQLDRHGLAVRAHRLPHDRGHEVPDLVRELRGVAGTRPLRVSPNHVFTGHPHMQGGGAQPPTPAGAYTENGTAADGDPLVAVLDTGLPERLGQWHPTLEAAAVGAPEAVDELDGDGDGELDFEAGHGTFVAGVVRRIAPGTRIRVERVLTPSGVGDEVTLAAALCRTGEPVVNLSLGGYTDGDEPPLALQEALATLGPDQLVVAAAGNGADDRPFYPAAFPGVVAVGAVGLDGDGAPSRAEFSNYGDWVDAAAPGVRVHSAYVVGRYGYTPEASEDFDRYAAWSGTSFATPIVSALIVRRMAERGLTARAAWQSLLDEGGRVRLPGLGVLFLPDVDVCV